MDLPSRPFTITGAARVYRAVRRDKGISDHDVLAARAAHPGGEPGVEDVVVWARQQRPEESVGAQNSHHRPTGGVAATGKAPVTGEPETARHGLSLASSRIEDAGSEGVRAARKKFLLALLGEVADPPLVHRPEGVAPGSGAAPPDEL